MELLVGVNNLLPASLPSGENVTPGGLSWMDGGLVIGLQGTTHSCAVVLDFAEDANYLISTQGYNSALVGTPYPSTPTPPSVQGG